MTLYRRAAMITIPVIDIMYETSFHHQMSGFISNTFTMIKISCALIAAKISQNTTAIPCAASIAC